MPLLVLAEINDKVMQPMEFMFVGLVLGGFTLLFGGVAAIFRAWMVVIPVVLTLSVVGWLMLNVIDSNLEKAIVYEEGEWWFLRMRASLGISYFLCTAPLWWVTRACRANQRRSAGRCVSCGYDLIGLGTQKCPECGQALLPEKGVPK